MANPYTGDFDAVGQFTEATINRLVASVHQNNFQNQTVPSFPHGAQLRIDASPPGTPQSERLLGGARTQVAVPRIELIDRSRSEVWLDLWVRSEYFPDPSTAPIPRFINGSVRVKYGVDGQSAAGHVVFKAEPGSLAVNVTTDDLVLMRPRKSTPDPKVPGRIIDIITDLLVNDFAVPPIQTPQELHLDQVISLRPTGADPVAALPFAFTGQPAGNIDSIQSGFTAGHDFAIAISSAAIMREVSKALEALKSWKAITTITIAVDDTIDLRTVGDFIGIPTSVAVHYTSTVGQPVATWHPTGSSATIHIEIGGTSISDSTLAPNADFNISLDLTLAFDPSSGSLTLTPGVPVASANVHGPLGGLLNPTVKSDIESNLNSYLPSTISGAQRQLASANAQLAGVSKFFTTVDAGAALHWNNADFNADAVVMRGTITVSARQEPTVTFARSPELVYDAFESWIPGGRIDDYEWAWIPYWEWLTGDPKPDSVLVDRYELIPSALPTLTKFGKAASGLPASLGLREPPFTDTEGAMFLRLRGVVTDVRTGQLVPIETPWIWQTFGRGPSLPPDVARVVNQRPLVARPRRLGPGAPVENGVFVGDPAETNTLYVHVGSKWSPGVANALAGGLEACTRRDASLLVNVIFDSSTFSRIDTKTARSLSRFLDKLPAPNMVLDDPGGQYADAIGKEPRRGTRWLIAAPGGGGMWAASGDIKGAALGQALDFYLVPTPPVLPVALEPEPRTLSAGITAALRRTAATPDAPYGNTTLTMFTAAGTASSQAAISGLAEAITGEQIAARAITVVVCGASEKDAVAVKRQLSRNVTVVADPNGAIAAQCGVVFLPTTVTLSGRGRILSSRVGAATPRTTGGRAR